MGRQAKRRTSRSRSGLMTTLLVVGGGVLVLLAALAALGGRKAAVEVTGQPRLKVDRETVDLGDVPLGRTVEAAFDLTNVGDQPLRLTRPPTIEVIEGC